MNLLHPRCIPGEHTRPRVSVGAPSRQPLLPRSRRREEADPSTRRKRRKGVLLKSPERGIYSASTSKTATMPSFSWCASLNGLRNTSHFRFGQHTCEESPTQNPNGVSSFSPGLARVPEGLPWVIPPKPSLTFERSEASNASISPLEPHNLHAQSILHWVERATSPIIRLVRSPKTLAEIFCLLTS